MRGDEVDEVLAVVTAVGPLLLAAQVAPVPEDPGTRLRRAVGLMMVDRNMAEPDYFAWVLANALDLVRQCNATVTTLERLRVAAVAMTPTKLPGILAKHHVIRLTLATEARILAVTTFRSRDEVEAVSVLMNAAFASTEEVAADELDQGTYVALITLHGRLVKHLTDRGRLLPRVISYKFQTIMPALQMAYLAYQDAQRAPELIAENNVVHPAFMPQEGRMLAV